MVGYEATCLECNKFYIGNTSQTLKKRMGQHFLNTKRLVQTGKALDLFASHYTTHFKLGSKIKRMNVRRICRTRILWHGNPISCCKSFGKSCCQLCMRERMEILRRHNKEPDKIINSCGEIYGACRHKPKFHRYTNKQKHQHC